MDFSRQATGSMAVNMASSQRTGPIAASGTIKLAQTSLASSSLASIFYKNRALAAIPSIPLQARVPKIGDESEKWQINAIFHITRGVADAFPRTDFSDALVFNGICPTSFIQGDSALYDKCLKKVIEDRATRKLGADTSYSCYGNSARKLVRSSDRR
jgi:hypothetical protein